MASSHTFHPGRISPPLLPHRLHHLLFDCCVVPPNGDHQGQRPVSLSLSFDSITSSPHVPTQRCLFFDVSPNVDTDYLLIVVFLKRTVAIKVEAPPTSLIFDECLLAPQTKEPASASASPTARDLRTLVREQRRDDVGGKSPLPMETEGQKPPEGGRRLLILVVVC